MRTSRSISPRLLAVLVTATLLMAAGCGEDEEPSGLTTGTTGPTRAAAPLLEHAFIGDDVTVDGAPHALVDESELRISFDAEGTLSAGAGCNNMFGATDPEVLDGGRIQVDQIGSTEMACAEDLMEQERWFADLLTAGLSWRYVDTSREIVLEGDGVVIRLLDEELARPEAPLEETVWRSDSMIRNDVVSNAPEDIAASLVFHDDGTVDVETGCNSGQGTWTLEEDVLRVEGVALTRMACDDARAELEAWLLGVLDAHPVTVERLANRLTLVGSDGLGISFNGALAEDVPASIPVTPSTAGA
jgi:heat shock protein HslJ